jgi:hypothetical protein
MNRTIHCFPPIHFGLGTNIVLNGCEIIMSARHSFPLVLTVFCLVQTAPASDLVYRESQAAGSENQLVLVTHESEVPATNAQAKAPLTSKFFRQNQQAGAQQTGRAPTAKAVPGDQTRLLQPKRVAAGRHAAPSGNSFKDRLRQLSSGEPVKQQTSVAAPPAVASRAAFTTEQAKAESPAVDNLVYLDDTASENKQAEPEVVLTQVYSEELEQAFSAVPDPASFAATADHGDDAPVPLPVPESDRIVFRPAVIDVSRNGQAVLRPDVLVAHQPPLPVPVPDGATTEELPAEPEAVVPEEWSASIVDGSYTEYMATAEPRLGPGQELFGRMCARLNGPCGCEKGLGTERVMHAISFVDTTQPMQNFRMRFDAAYDYESPDRAEYFWAQIGSRGPAAVPPGPAPSVDYQDIRTYMEVGGDKFSVGTDVPIRIIDPDGGYANTSGLSDVNITTKLLFLDGHFWQITNLFRTHIPSGDANRGLGTGHAAIEPGFAIRYKWSDYTYFHGDLKYWVPLGGDPEFEGEVLNYGIAMSHVWRETDCFAIMPTIELRGYSFLDGLQTESIVTVPQVVDVDPEGILIVHPGIRWAFDHGTDCSLREIGLFGGFAATSDSLYQELLRLEFRWSW